jgi:hypothetical protein
MEPGVTAYDILNRISIDKHSCRRLLKQSSKLYIKLSLLAGIAKERLEFFTRYLALEPRSYRQGASLQPDVERASTMQVDVIVLLRRTTQAIAAWQYVTDQNERFLILNESGNRLPPEKAWAQLASNINKRANTDSSMPVDVFLILRKSLPENFYDEGRLEIIINDARNHAWGGDIYIVWDQKADTGFNNLYGRNQTAFEKWFRMLIDCGVTALIEIPKKIKLEEPNESIILRKYAQEANDRREHLQKLVSNNGWSVVLRDEACLLDAFIKQHVEQDTLPSTSTNQIIFYDRKPRRGLSYLLEKARDSYRGGKRFVAAVPGIDARDLEGLCKQESADLKLILFSSIFEWLYAFIRLDQASRPSSARLSTNCNQAYCNDDHITWVKPSRKIRFQPKSNDAEMRLLVTSAFNQAQEKDHCTEAAKEIGESLRNLPFQVEIEVYPYITCETFPDVLAGKQFTAWLHIGHGNRKEGLYEGRANQFASPDRWLTCFNAYPGSLQLVILSACYSAQMARSLAEAGVCVAIGFEKQVLTVAARKLTERVLPAVFQAGDKQRASLDAFRQVFGELDSRTCLQGTQQKRYSDARPRAFAINLKSS